MQQKSSKICTSDGKVCFEKKDLQRMVRESGSHKHRNESSLFIIGYLYRKHTIYVLIALLSALALFTYGSDGWMIVRFLGFSLICYIMIYFTMFTAPAFIFFSIDFYRWLVDWTEIGKTTLSATVFSVSIAIGIIAFVLLVFSMGGLRGYILGRKSK